MRQSAQALTQDTDPDFLSILHNHTICLDGSPDWSKPFYKRIGNVSARDMAAAQRWRKWWENGYITGRLVASCSTSKQRDKVIAVLSLIRSGYEWQKISATHRISINELARTERRITRQVRATYATYADRPY